MRSERHGFHSPPVPSARARPVSAARSKSSCAASRRGQSLVEFSVALPVLLLVLLVGLDFGRIYLGWINIQNMTRIAANFAANHADAWRLNDAGAKAAYQAQVLADAKSTNCTIPGGVVP